MPDDTKKSKEDINNRVDLNDPVRHASAEARVQALKRMQATREGSQQTESIAVSDQLIQVKIYSPFNVYYDQSANSVSAVNGTGPFDILPGHKNFLTLLSSGDVVVRSSGKADEQFKIDRGVMHVHADVVKVFLDV